VGRRLRHSPLDRAAEVLVVWEVVLGEPGRFADEAHDFVQRPQLVERGAQLGARAVAGEKGVAGLLVINGEDRVVPTDVAGAVVGPVDDRDDAVRRRVDEDVLGLQVTVAPRQVWGSEQRRGRT
jgi:hypothetical protein